MWALMSLTRRAIVSAIGFMRSVALAMDTLTVGTGRNVGVGVHVVRCRTPALVGRVVGGVVRLLRVAVEAGWGSARRCAP